MDNGRESKWKSNDDRNEQNSGRRESIKFKFKFEDGEQIEDSQDLEDVQKLIEDGGERIEDVKNLEDGRSLIGDGEQVEDDQGYKQNKRNSGEDIKNIEIRTGIGDQMLSYISEESKLNEKIGTFQKNLSKNEIEWFESSEEVFNGWASHKTQYDEYCGAYNEETISCLQPSSINTSEWKVKENNVIENIINKIEGVDDRKEYMSLEQVVQIPNELDEYERRGSAEAFYRNRADIMVTSNKELLGRLSVAGQFGVTLRSTGWYGRSGRALDG